MATSFNEIAQEARALAAAADRPKLAETLLEPLQAPPSGIETARAQEIEKRIAAFDRRKEPGLGARLTVRTLAFQLAGSPATKILGEFFSRTFLMVSCIGPTPTGSPSLRPRPVHVGQAAGNCVLGTANKSLQPTGYAGG